MKEIVALIRPGKSRLTKQKLAESGFSAWTEVSVLGRGKQRGLCYSDQEGLGFGVPFLPKRMLILVVNDEEVGQVIGVLSDANRTGEIGDGKIFLCPLDDAVRIRTDERGRDALTGLEEVSKDAPF
ncbi:MAG: P-II family nitrogen regulator [Candidatus Omnitrophica bacterium]|nr:P-II family nitrogen regulator [Candidatus Omnitrophota bacterium]